ncbi:BlaI/MecI/CopY family transcriptional regulator [soil metagenome]
MQQRGFGDLEAVVMDQVWANGDAVTVRDVFDELASRRDIAYTTVMSTMDNLHRKGWLARERSGKAYVYWATMTREERSANLMSEAFHAGGDTDLVLSHFLGQMKPEESEKIRAALRRVSRRRPVS